MIYLIDFCGFPWSILPWLLSGLLGFLMGYFWMKKWQNKFQEMEGKYNSLRKANDKLQADLDECSHKRAILEGDITTANGMVKEMKGKLDDANASLAAANESLAANSGNDRGKGASSMVSGAAGMAAGLAATSGGKGKDGNETGGSGKGDSSEGGDTEGDVSKADAGNAEGSDSSGGSGDLSTMASGLTAGAVAGITGSSDDSTSTTSSVGGNSGSGSGAYGKLKSDNLQIIEGIGPKMESVLHDAGIKNWSDLAGKSEADLRTILDSHGSKYKIINPSTWGQQAALADAGKWDELVLLQKQLDTGAATNIGMTDSKLEKMMAKTSKGKFSKFKDNDLKIVEGVGPKIAELMNNAGINTWAELAKTSEGRLQEILDAAGSRYKLARPGSWPRQAGLAAAGQWEALEKLQDELDGGK